MHHTLTVLLFTLGLLQVLTLASSAQAANPAANRLLGQADFTHNGANIGGAQGLNLPGAVAIDRSSNPNRIYVADSANNRVLGWSNASSFSNGQAADLEIGQPDFYSAVCSNGGINAQTLCNPTSVAVDAAGNLYVADTGNNRALEYSTPYSHIVLAGVGNNIANQVFGQNGVTTGVCTRPVSASTLCAPNAVAVDAGNNLYIADSQNNRTLEYNTPLVGTGVPGSGDSIADLVFGQGNMTSAGCNLGTNSITASSLCLPQGVAADAAGNVYIGDTRNNRVLEFNTPLAKGNTAADMVFGQNGFASNSCNQGTAAGANTLCSPQGLATDSNGDFYIADTGNHRGLEYFTPLAVTSTPGSGDTIADLVFGQGNSFSPSSCNLTNANPTATSLCGPQGLAIDGAGNLYIADTQNGRVLEYAAPLSSSSSTAGSVLGKTDFVHRGANITNAQGLYWPLTVAIDATVTPNHMYVADSLNNRVLGWKSASAFANGAAADLVIGQPSFSSSAVNAGGGTTASSFDYPEGLAVDRGGNLWVADTYNDRVVEFNTPYLTGGIPVAGLVLGQPNFTSGGCNGVSSFTVQPPPTANTLCEAVGVAVDSAGNVYASDADNNRVVEYNSPLATGNTTGNMVFGQPNFTSDGCNTAGMGSPPSATTMCTPEGIAVDTQGNLFVNDHLNSRVLEFKTPVSTGNTMPTAVFGQPNYTSSGCSLGTSGLCQPRGVVVDPAGNVYISDSFNHRVLEFNTPLATGNTNTKMVFGQNGNFNSGLCDISPGVGPTANDMCRPSGLSLDSAANLYVADALNNRVLEFNQPLPTPSPTSSSTPTPTPTPTPSSGGSPVAVSPTLIGFGTQVLNTTSTPVLVQLTNNQNSQVSISGINFSGTKPADFVETNNCTPRVAANSSCSISVTFTPQATGERTAAINVADNAANSPQSVSLVGQGVLAVGLSPGSFTFYAVPVGSTSSSQNFILKNNQTLALNINSISIGGSNPGDFVQTNNCNGSMLSGASCIISVVFKPTVATVRNATLIVSDDAANSPQTSFLAGTTPVGFSPPSSALGPAAMGSTSTPVNFALRNYQSVPLTLAGISIGGANPRDFAQINNCPASLPASGSCTVTVTFTPTAAGKRQATLSATDNAPGSPQSATVVGLPPS